MSASETRLRDKPRPKAPPELALLQTHSLTKSYYGRTVVRDVSVKITQGETVGLLGPNGAGKTTTFNMVVGGGPTRCRACGAQPKRHHGHAHVRQGTARHQLPPTRTLHIP